MSWHIGNPTSDEIIERATELANEQNERYEKFKRFYRNPDSSTDVITAFLSDPVEAQTIFLQMNYLVKADIQRKEEATQTNSSKK